LIQHRWTATVVAKAKINIRLFGLHPERVKTLKQLRMQLFAVPQSDYILQMCDTVYHALESKSSISLHQKAIPVAPNVQQEKPLPNVSQQSPFLVRIGTFALMESVFIATGFLAMKKQLQLSTNPILPTEVKAAVTLISIAWHTLAIFMVKDIALQIFSAEWMEQVRQNGNIPLAETDRVSQISSGYIDQIQHFISPTATYQF